MEFDFSSLKVQNVTILHAVYFWSYPLTKSPLILNLEVKLGKALTRLEASHLRLPTLPTKGQAFDDEGLGRFEEFMSRYARLTDIFMSQYLRARVVAGDPAFRGTLRDILDQAEKSMLIDSADEWFAIRELRNRQAHEYEEDDLLGIFQQALKSWPRIKSIADALKK